MKTYSAKEIASYFIKKSDQNHENDLTNLKLQKMLYYAQAEYLRTYGSPLFIDQIEAWDLGPVIKNIYMWLKRCGAYPISTFDVSIDCDEIQDDIEKFLDIIWTKYSKYSASYLVSKTHEPGGPWDIVFHNSDTITKIIDLKKINTVKLQNEWG